MGVKSNQPITLILVLLGFEIHLHRLIGKLSMWFGFATLNLKTSIVVTVITYNQ